MPSLDFTGSQKVQYFDATFDDAFVSPSFEIAAIYLQPKTN